MFWLKLLLVLCANCARQCSRSVVCLRVAARGPCRTRHLVCTVASSDPAEHKKVGCDCTGLQVQLDCFTIGGLGNLLLRVHFVSCPGLRERALGPSRGPIRTRRLGPTLSPACACCRLAARSFRARRLRATLRWAVGQLVDSEAIYEISGSRSGKTHRVWVDLKLCTAACGCRAYLQPWLRPKQLVCVAPLRLRAAHRPPRRRVPTRCFRGPPFAVAMRSATLPIRARALRVLRQSREVSLRMRAQPRPSTCHSGRPGGGS